MNQIKREIIEQIKQIITNEYQIEIEQVELEIPKSVENGHFSSNVALKYCKVLNDKPVVIANKIANNFNNHVHIDAVEVAKIGFINFYLSEQFFKESLIALNQLNDFSLVAEQKQKINVEFVSANPTGNLHLGHARNAIYGDSVIRLLRKVGHEVGAEYYINDAGAQMQNLGLSVKHFYYQEAQKDFEFPQDGYKGKEIQQIAKTLFEEYRDSKLDASDEWFKTIAYEKCLEEIKVILKKLDVNFNIWSSEQYYHDTGLVKKSLEVLKETNDLYEKDGAYWLNTTKYGDDKNRVIKKSDGSHTYLTSDIAYHLDKFNRGFEKSIDIWGGDHHGYINRVKCAIKSLGYNDQNLEILLIQMVNVIQNNAKVKMSKRKGTSITINDLLEEIDVDVLRYFFVMRSPDTQLDFDLDLTKKRSSENPVFYIQYAHARICSLIDKAQKQNYVFNNKIDKLSTSEMVLVYELLKYQQVIVEAADKRLPHLVANYLYELASLYHRYYNAEKVFNDNQMQINDKIFIALSVKKVISDGLDLLGIKAKATM